MNTYKIRLKGYETETFICAKTAGKAKYKHYLQLDELFDDFNIYLKYIDECNYIHKTKKEDYFRKDRDFNKIKNYRNVPLADYGMNVELNGKRGFIIGCNDSCNFDIKFDDSVFNCHPNYEMIYFSDNGEILYDFSKKKEKI